MTPNPNDDLTLRIQCGFLSVSEELQRIDRQISALVDCLDGRPGPLPMEIASVAEAVRRDLLHDAIETLQQMGRQTEESVLIRQQAVEMARRSVACSF